MSESDLPAEDEQGKAVSRRRFLFLAGAGGLVLAVGSSGGPPDDVITDIALAATATRSLHLRRREDSLNLRIDLFNADLARTSTGSELREVGAGSAFMVVHFPPQAVLERTLTTALGTGDLPGSRGRDGWPSTSPRLCRWPRRSTRCRRGPRSRPG